MELNDNQLAAVTESAQCVIVVAGAGSGKTQTIAHRIVHHLQTTQGARPDAVLALTFTNAAAAEMRDRLNALDPMSRPGWACTVATFHSLCLLILREHAHCLGFDSITVASRDTVRGLLEQALSEWRDADPEHPPALSDKALDALLRGLDEVGTGEASDPMLDFVAARYAELKREASTCDFGDLIAHVRTLLRRDNRVRAALHSRFSFIVVDEFQDTSQAQMDILALLVTPPELDPATDPWHFRPTVQLTVVGDDDQSIYGWRGASGVANFDALAAATPSPVTILLAANYRCGIHILHAASQVIGCNTKRMPKTLHATRDSATQLVAVFAGDSLDAEFDHIADAIAARGPPFADVAVLFRSDPNNRLSDRLGALLGARLIPFVTTRKAQLIETVEFSGLADALQANDRNLRQTFNTAMTIHPTPDARRNIDAYIRVVQKVAAAAADSAGVSSEARSGLAVAIDRHLPSVASPGLPTLGGLVADLSALLALVAYERSSSADDDEPSDCVTLSTIHGAKGREWPAVLWPTLSTAFCHRAAP
ncbi:UvrD/REP helicase [Thecamonas trahens ATCC 50062]|uniref:DNA 3'-5' helicase n=1 Tax=Thecamonas trahens ATCC 50062 TaxID=461836 RepID=A0A0L0DAV3_THETB|nr:UvrD/REP helicase [Thecamonas trahens ATCC 50062]KNC48428.1 UvrD/REP helicase [Thecamonas trahens ATCC 50062]|eukprot:XP_013758543.1 UvrD/REP helicase [Thecamonas trahens ATCC 50062]